MKVRLNFLIVGKGQVAMRGEIILPELDIGDGSNSDGEGDMHVCGDSDNDA